MVKLVRLEEPREFKDIVYASNYWKIKFPQDRMNELADQVQKLINERNPHWQNILNQEIISRMNLVKAKDVGTDPEQVEFVATVKEAAKNFLNEMKINLTPSQQTLDEGIEDLKAKKKKAKAD